MARGKGARVRKPKKSEDSQPSNSLDNIFDVSGNGGNHDFGQMAMKEEPVVETVDEDDDSEDEDEDVPLPKQRRGGSNVEIPQSKPKDKGIKTLPLIFLLLMVGTSVLPALIYAGDFASVFLAKNDVLGHIGFRLGIGNVPRRRVLSFYEKHAPEKLDDVPGILAKHYGEYPKLIKKLERKYQDYGYFLGWEDDESPMRLMQVQTAELSAELYSTWINSYWNVYAPDIAKTGARNAKYNLTHLYKQFKRAWKKHIWPLLEPIFGVPDGADKQKRKDAAEARKRREAAGTATGKKQARRRNREYRDEDEM